MAIQLINNRGFESGALSPGWRQVRGSAVLDGGVTDATSHTGDYSLELRGMDFVEHSFAGVRARATGDLTFQAKAATRTGGPFFVRIDYSDGSETTTWFSRLNTRWARQTCTVDRSKQLAKIVFGTGEIEAVYIDEVSLVGSKRTLVGRG